MDVEDRTNEEGRKRGMKIATRLVRERRKNELKDEQKAEYIETEYIPSHYCDGPSPELIAEISWF